MTRRIIFAVFGLMVVFSGFFVRELLFLLILTIGIVAVLCTWEIAAMMRRKGQRIYRRIASWGVLALIAEALYWQMEYSVLVFGTCVCLAWLVRMWGRIEGAWLDVSGTVFTLAYVGLPMAVFTRLLVLGIDAKAWLLLTLCVIWTTDSCALFVGKKYGRNKLWPKISPGKTWEGSLGGVMGSLVLVLLARLLFPSVFGTASAFELVLFAVGFSVIGQLGDLAESLLKRDAGVKDSGSEWTGHGGFLDLMDAALFSAIPLLVFLQVFHPEVLVLQP